MRRPPVLATALAVLGLVVLAGWVFRFEPLLSIVPGLATMKPVTAIGFVLLGASVWVFAAAESTTLHRLPAGVVALLGVVSVLEYRLGVSGTLLGVPFEGAEAYRVSEATGWCLALSGTSLLGMPRRGGWNWPQLFQWLVGAVAVTAALGYLYGVQELYSVVAFQSMAFHTAVGFALFAVAGLRLQPDGLAALLRGATPGGMIARRLLPALLLLLTVLGGLEVYGVELGWYRPAVGIALGVVLGLGIATGLVGWYAQALNRSEEGRRRLEKRVRRLGRARAIGEMAASVAHDFNNLVMSMTASIDTLRSETGERAERELDALDAVTNRAADLLRRVLSTGGVARPRPRVFPVDAAIREIAPVIRRVLTRRHRLDLDLDGSGALVRVDPVHLDQILVNLVANGRDAMTEPGQLVIGTSRVRVESQSDSTIAGLPDGRYVVISVGDSGAGIEPGRATQVFEPFFTTKGRDGTGLGLSTVRSVTEINGGVVHLETGHPGGGALFRVYLPEEQPTATPPAPEEPPNVGRSVGDVA